MELAKIIQETSTARKPRDPVVCRWQNAGRCCTLFVKLRQNIWFTVTANSPVYVDSPLAVEATNIFAITRKNATIRMQQRSCTGGINPILFPGLKLWITSDESKAINFNETKGHHLYGAACAMQAESSIT